MKMKKKKRSCGKVLDLWRKEKMVIKGEEDVSVISKGRIERGLRE